MDILRQIIDIDAVARERMEKIREEQKFLKTQNATKTSAESSAAIESAQKELDEYRAKMESELSRRLSGAQKERNERCAQLDRIFAENADIWRGDIIKRITS